MTREDMEQAVSIVVKSLLFISECGEDIMDMYYMSVDNCRKEIQSKNMIGNIGIVKKRAQIKGDYYFYWATFKSGPLQKDGTRNRYATVIKKGGASKYVYKMSAFENMALDWEMELIREYEPMLAMLREASKKQRDALRYLKKALSATKKVVDLANG